MKKLMILVLVLLSVFGCTSNTEETVYDTEEILQLVMPGKEGTLEEELIVISKDVSYYHGLTEDNLEYYNKILNKLDEILGAGNYQLISVFESRLGSSITYTSYVMHVVADEFLELYQNWKGSSGLLNPDDSFNPYRMVFSVDAQGAQKGIVSGDYFAIKSGYDLIQNFNHAYQEKFPAYHMNFNHIRLFDYDIYLSLSFVGSWQEAAERVGEGNSLNIFVPYGTSEEEIDKVLKDNEDFFKSYFINEIVVVELNEGEGLEEILVNERLYKNSYRYADDKYPHIYIYSIS